MKSLLYGKDELKVFKLLWNKIEYDYPNFKENFLFKNENEKSEDVVKILARFILQWKNKKLEKKLLKKLKNKIHLNLILTIW